MVVEKHRDSTASSRVYFTVSLCGKIQDLVRESVGACERWLLLCVNVNLDISRCAAKKYCKLTPAGYVHWPAFGLGCWSDSVRVALLLFICLANK